MYIIVFFGNGYLIANFLIWVFIFDMFQHTKPENSTDFRLTGIPQIDYQWDPNLPRELNG